MIDQFTEVVFPSKGNQDHDLSSYNIGLPQLQLMMSTHAQLSGMAERILYWGEGALTSKRRRRKLVGVLGEFSGSKV